MFSTCHFANNKDFREGRLHGLVSTVYSPFDYRIKIHLTQEKEAVILQETKPDLPVSVQEFPAEEWICGGLLHGWGHLSEWSWDLLKEVDIFFITIAIVCSQAKQQGGKTAPPINKTLALPIRTRMSLPLSLPLSSKSFHTPLILIIQGVARMKTTITEN